jgi:hypothetical protein
VWGCLHSYFVHNTHGDPVDPVVSLSNLLEITFQAKKESARVFKMIL